MKGRILLLAAVLGAGGCVTVPKSSTELVETSTHVHDFCYQLPRDEVGRRIVELLSQCYGPVGTAIPIGSVYVPISADFQVINEKLPDGNRYSVRNFAGFAYSADVLEGDPYCETRVHMYAITGFWDKTIDAADRAVNGAAVTCP